MFWHDHLHYLVSHRCSSCSRPGTLHQKMNTDHIITHWCYINWYFTIFNGFELQVKWVIHTGPKKLVLYFTGATNILYTFGGHAVTVWAFTFLLLFSFRSFTCFYTASVCSFCRCFWVSRPADKIMQIIFFLFPISPSLSIFYRIEIEQ